MTTTKMLTQLLIAIAVTAVDSYRIGVVPKFLKSPDGFFGFAEQGCKDSAANHANVTCFFNGTYNASIEGSLEIINDLIDDNAVDAIAISVLDDEAYTPVINRGIAQGKPIITFDSDAPSSRRLAYIGTDNFKMGRELAKLLKQIRPNGGTFGIVSAYGDNLASRVEGVRDNLKGTPWVEVPGSPKNGQEDSDISLEKMWEFVKENPEIDAIVSVTGMPMFKEDTTDWKHFVNENRNVLTVIADTLSVQLRLMQTSYVDALVGQLPYNMGYQCADTLIEVLDAVGRGVPLNESLNDEVVFGTHQLEVLRIPLNLPGVDFDFNYIGSLAIVGYVLCAIIILASIGFMSWTWYYRTTSVVMSGQPVFLYMICIGTVLMGSAILPLSIDDENGQRAADIACMCSPWLINIGFTVSFSALFSKIFRLNKILLGKRRKLRRIKVTEKDVMWPFIILLTVNVIALICWTAIAPLKYVRTFEAGTDPWNRPIGSYGQCRSTSGAAGNSIPYAVVIGVVNITALVFANFQAYRARNIHTEFNESTYVAMANASFLQAIFVCVPILFLTRDNPQANFIVLSVILFILSGAILVFIFVPKILALKNQRKNPSRRSTSYFGPDHVSILLDQYQSLSWDEKAVVLRKLAPPAERSGEECFQSKSTEIVEESKDSLGVTNRKDAEVVMEEGQTSFRGTTVDDLGKDVDVTEEGTAV